MFCPALLLSAAELHWSRGHLLPDFPAAAASIDAIELKDASGGDMDLFASLEGIVNRKQPRLACIGPSDAEGDRFWLRTHHLNVSPIDGFAAVEKYKAELNGLVVTDPARLETRNLATTLAGLDNALICEPELLAKLTNAPVNLKICQDLRGRFADRAEVYEYLLKEVWPRCTRHILAGLSPRMQGNLRDFLVAANAAVVWLDPRNPADAELLARFAPELKPGQALYMGWWPDEDAGLKWIGQFGVPVLASDFFHNGSLLGGVHDRITPPRVAPPPPLQKKIYVAFFLSDGDNIQYMQHSLRRLWSDPSRGKVPIGWTVSPLSADLDPALLNYYYRTATTNDCLVSGPSGAGYGRLDFWKPSDLDHFTKLTNPYLKRSGLRIITVWLRVNDQIGNSFAENCPALLGLISHEGGARAQFFGALPMIGLVGQANYAGSVDQLRSGLEREAAHWDGSQPEFLAVQGNAWRVGASGLLKLAQSLDTNRFVVVRPDHLFALFSQWHRHGSPQRK
jgi:GxGYxYP putative glycoside hydrolase C-terminal domain/GxGYxYP third domain/GxGYxYP_N second domain